MKFIKDMQRRSLSIGEGEGGRGQMPRSEPNVQECDPEESGQAATDDDSSNTAWLIKKRKTKHNG